MMFNKFVPSYHHHFGHQCRVSDYGYSKLQDLFEAIPHVVEVGLLFSVYHRPSNDIYCTMLLKAHTLNEFSAF